MCECRKGGIMNNINKEKVLSLANNGMVTTSDVTSLGLHRGILKELCDCGELVKVSRGIYSLPDSWEDEYALLQNKYGKGIYSKGTALYLYGYSDRVPLSLEMTFPVNYNCQSLKHENIDVNRVINKNYDLGLSEAVTPFGNKVKAYDLERCLCDIVKGNHNDIQLVQYAMKKYVLSKDKDINKLMEYAKKLRVVPKIRRYMEVLL